MLHTVQERLASDVMESKWREILSEWSGDDATKESLVHWVRAERDNTIELAESATHEDDLETSVMIRYIELRSQWIRYNALTNYLRLRSGRESREMMLRGVLASSLVEALEPVINKNDLRKACDFMVAPLLSPAAPHPQGGR